MACRIDRLGDVRLPVLAVWAARRRLGVSLDAAEMLVDRRPGDVEDPRTLGDIAVHGLKDLADLAAFCAVERVPLALRTDLGRQILDEGGDRRLVDETRKLKEITERFRLTVVYVTHDQNEAMTFAERVIVMSDGRVVQAGAPEELFEYPLTTYVGRFIGSPAMNFLNATIDRGIVVFDGRPLATSHPSLPPEPGQAQVGIRPEYLEFAGEPGANVVPAAVTNVRDHGSVRVVEVAVGGADMKLKIAREKPVPSGDVLVRLPPEKIRIYIEGKILAGAAAAGGDIGGSAR